MVTAIIIRNSLKKAKNMIRSAKFALQSALSIMLFSLLTACAEDPPSSGSEAEATPTPFPTPEGLTDLPEGDNTLQGTVAYGAAAAYADVCVIGTTRCTRANANGEYNLTPIEVDAGYLSASFLNESGQSQTLYSLFSFADAPAETAHINPSTDVIARMAAIQDCDEGLPPSAANTCLASADTVQTTLTALQNLLGPLWPNGRNPFVGSYETNPDTDDLDRLHEMANYLINGEQIEVVDINGTLLARARLDQLDAIAAGATPSGVQITSDALAGEAERAYRDQVPRQQQDRFEMIVSVLPANAMGPTEFASQVRVRANPAQATNEAARARFTLLFFDGRMAEWEQEFDEPLSQSFTNIDSGSFWLSDIGTYTLIVDLLIVDNLAAESLVLTSSQDITVGLPAGTNPVNYNYGAAGSCFSQPADNTRDFYFCLESANGITYSDGQQNNGLDALCTISDDDYPFLRQAGRCPQDLLHGGFYSGYCTLVNGYGRIYFYQSPVRDYGAVGGAISLAERRCTNQGGTWTGAS